jgi:hypothetical protein
MLQNHDSSAVLADDGLTPAEIDLCGEVYAEALNFLRQTIAQLIPVMGTQFPAANINTVGLCLGRAAVDAGVDIMAASVHIPIHSAQRTAGAIKQGVDQQLAVAAEEYR